MLALIICNNLLWLNTWSSEARVQVQVLGHGHGVLPAQGEDGEYEPHARRYPGHDLCPQVRHPSRVDFH